jgi:hypothetical protein
MRWKKTILATVSMGALLAGFSAVDCGGASNEQCVPGATQVCVGPGACVGGQSCRGDGKGYDPCVCGAPDAAVDAFSGGSSSGASGSGSSSGSSIDASSESSSGSDAGKGPWDCLNDPPQTYPAGSTTKVTVLAIDSLQPILQAEKVDGGSGLDVLQYTALPGVQIRACSSLLQPACNDSASLMWQPQTSDDAGVTTFTLPQDFAGFFQITGSNLFSTSFFPGPFVAGEATSTLPGTLLPLSAVMGLEQILPGLTIDLQPDGGLGSVVLSVFDCQDHFAPGVAFVPGAVAPPGSAYRTTIFYTQGQGQMEFPSTSATATDNAGAGGILNVPQGAFTVRAILQSTGQPIATVDTFVNPGFATLVFVRTRTAH